MSEYHAPVKDMLFTIQHLANLSEVSALPGCEEATPDLVEAVLEEAATLAGEVIGPTNRLGDAQGTTVENDQVRVPPEFIAAYQQFVEGGWPGLAQEVELGGQGLPFLVGIAVEEMWQSANLAWSLGPLLSQGAARAVIAHASGPLRDLYAPRLVSGEWTGTMNLTEPQAGSDLAHVRTQAVPEGDHYLLTGQKIFITWGDHDMTDNVVHLVLARLPDAPEGTRGISLFLVPKVLVNESGELGERNHVRPISVEHKLGIHGSPTCVMAFEGARAFLVGEPNQGLVAMFTMMNHARIGVGLEGVAISERSYQQAREYALERVQGRGPDGQDKVRIIRHPDVRRMLMTMKCQIMAMRALAYTTAAHLDHAHRNPDPGERVRHARRVELLTPVVKGWCTETAQELTSIGLQVHGGMGYVEETGAAQHMRDARITTIYEGTTGIQAGDLTGRKILRDGGEAMEDLMADVRRTDGELSRHGANLTVVRSALEEGLGALQGATRWLLENYQRDSAVAGAASFNLLMLTGVVTAGWQMARGALAAQEALAAGSGDESFYRTRLVTAQFYAEHIMPKALSYARAIEAGSETTMALHDDDF